MPDFILELQSSSTADTDVNEKKKIYAESLRTPEYFHYGPDDPDLGEHRDVLAGHRLTDRGTYEPIKAISETLARSLMPTLFLIGDKDRVTAHIGPRRMIDRMLNARLELIKDAGHYFQEDQPEAVAQRILEFLSEAGANAAPGSTTRDK